MRMPISKSGGARFRGPTSSHEYNQNERDKYLDLINLYKESYETQLNLTEAYQTVLFENLALNQYINMLEGKLASLEDKITRIESENYNGMYSKTAFVQDMQTHYPTEIQDKQDATSRCQIEYPYRFATLPQIHRIPKTHAVDSSGSYIIPKDLKVTIHRSNEKGKVVDNDIYKAFDGKDHSYWRRTVTYHSISDVPENGEDAIIEIELPTKLVNNLNINTIAIHPHPERGIEIKNVEIQYQNAWQSVLGLEQEELTTIKSKNYSSRRKWFFPNTPVQKIRITLVQHHSMQIDEKIVFSLGLQEVSVALTTFEPSGGIVLTPFTMEGIYNIEDVEFVFSNRKAFSYPRNMDHMLKGNIFDYEIYIEEPDGTLRMLDSKDWNSQIASRIWIKTHLYPDPHNGVNPCLHSIRLHYSKA